MRPQTLDRVQSQYSANHTRAGRQFSTGQALDKPVNSRLSARNRLRAAPS